MTNLFAYGAIQCGLSVCNDCSKSRLDVVDQVKQRVCDRCVAVVLSSVGDSGTISLLCPVPCLCGVLLSAIAPPR